MNKQKLGIAFSIALAAALPLGCSSGMVNQPAKVSVGNPLAMMSLGAAQGATITIDVGSLRAGFKTKAVAAKTTADVDWLTIELVTDASSPADYSTPAALGGVTYVMGGPGASIVTGMPGSAAADDANDRMQFTNVPPGSYRARVKAWEAGPDNIYATGDDLQINKNSALNSNGAPPFGSGTDWSVSTNTATVFAGSPGASYSTGTELQVPVDLLDEKNDPVDVQLTINNGFSAPSVNGSDI